MARRANQHPTDVELEILQVLWELGPASLSSICSRLREQREVATTTVATMLKVMLEKGWVTREGDGRGSTWRAAVSRRKAANGLIGKLVERVFDGSAQRLVAHLVESGQLSEQELEELRRLASGGGQPATGKKRPRKPGGGRQT